MKKQNTKKKGNLSRELELQGKTSASFHDGVLTVTGPKGEVKRTFKQNTIALRVDGNKILMSSKRETKKDKKIMGSLVAHIKNMMRGSAEGHSYTLKICSGHFPMNVSVSGSKFTVKNFLGEKVPRTLHLKDGASVKVEGEMIHVTSPNKETAGQVSADIEQLTRRPGFDTRIFQDGIYLINKDGKDLK